METLNKKQTDEIKEKVDELLNKAKEGNNASEYYRAFISDEVVKIVNEVLEKE